MHFRSGWARIVPLVLCFLACSGTPGLARDANLLRVMTYNIRLDTPADGNNSWVHRREMLSAQMQWLRPDVFGLQEVVIHQKRDIAEAMDGYALIGSGRDDGRDAGESSPVGYSKRRFKLLDSNTFWLSPTPSIPSKGWDAAYPRVATWVRLRDRTSGKTILAMNTHWDHVGVEARRQSAQMLLTWLKQHRKRADYVILIGDFNAEPDSPEMQVLTAAGGPTGLRDARTHARTKPFGPLGTFNDFKLQPDSSKAIDHILVGGQPGSEIDVIRYAVIAQHVDGRLISDHFPVLAELELK